MKLNTLKLKKILESRNLNQSWLADQLMIHRATVSAWMQNPENAKLKTISDIANALDIDDLSHCALLRCASQVLIDSTRQVIDDP